MATPTAPALTKSSTCPLDCPDACSLEVEVRNGHLLALDGTERNPLTQGFICGKVRNIADHVYGAERLRSPAVRVGKKGEARFRDVGWDEALDLIVQKLQAAKSKSGGESILPFNYGGSNGFLTQGTTDARFFHRLGASRLLRTFCAAPTGRAATGLYGRMPGVALTDYPLAKLIVVWGMNPSASGIHLVPILKDAQKKGAKLVVVDPRAIPIAKTADLHIAPKPGTDVVLALALINTLFNEGKADLKFLETWTHGHEELRARAAKWSLERAAQVAGVDVDELRTLFDWYVQANPAVIRCGWGPERNRNGGSSTAAVLAIPAVAGKFGVRGGGYTMSNSGAWKFLANAAASLEPEPSTRELNMSQLGRLLLETNNPRIEALFVFNANPLATAPAQARVERGLRREDLFTIVYDQVLTDTARYADVLLPATTFLEHTELSRGYGAQALQYAPPTIDPVGEAKPNYEVFGELCRRMGLERPGDTSDPKLLTDRLLDASGHGPMLQQGLAENGIAFPPTGNAPILFGDSFPLTPDKKVHFCPPELDRECSGGLYRFADDPATKTHPLALISPSSSQTISSTFGQLLSAPARVSIHPTDAQNRGIRDGDTVRIFNENGEVRCLAEVTEDVRPGVMSLHKGLWSRHTQNGFTANALAPDTEADLGRGACYNDARVEIERAAK